jgi:hypothetical protein
MSAYREPAEIAADMPAPQKRRVRVRKDVPMIWHIVVIAVCGLGVGALGDVLSMTAKWHGLIGAGMVLLVLLGVAALVTFGSLTYLGWGSEPEGDE